MRLGVLNQNRDHIVDAFAALVLTIIARWPRLRWISVKTPSTPTDQGPQRRPKGFATRCSC